MRREKGLVVLVKREIPPALTSSASQGWRTPGWIADKAREVLGGIALDPASDAEANVTIKAERVYTKRDDGLTRAWAGRVWCNPPYGKGERNKSNQGLWSEKMAREFHTGRMRSGLLLVTARTGDKWFRSLWDNAAELCFFYRRVAFVGPSSGVPEKSPSQSNVLALYTDSVMKRERFRKLFRDHGRIVSAETGR